MITDHSVWLQLATKRPHIQVLCCDSSSWTLHCTARGVEKWQVLRESRQIYR